MSKQFLKEIQSIRDDMDKVAKNDTDKVLAAYKRSLNDIRAEIANIYIQYAVDGQLKISKQQRYTVLKNIEKQLIKQAQELGNVDLGHTTKILEDVYQESFYKTAYTIDKGIDTVLDFSIVRPEFINTAVNTSVKGEMFSDRIWNNKSKLVTRVKREIEKGVTSGDSIDKMAKRIKKEFGTSAFESRRLIQNEMTRVVSQAQDDIYRESEVVQEIMFDATLDEKTSDICQELDGNTYRTDEPHPRIPENTHVGCRSAYIPIVKGWSPTKKRENIKNGEGNKPIIDYTNYEAWKKSRLS